MVSVYDIEALRNFFLYLDYNLDTGKISTFEISLFNNDLLPLMEHLSKVKAQVGFNNLGYDAQVIHHLRKNYESLKDLDGEAIAEWIADYSNYVISGQNENRWPDYREYEFDILQLDLFKIWHYDNKQRSCSLKWLQYSMDWHNIEDMPIHHMDRITDPEVAQSIRKYCLNDVLSTYQFYKITKGDTNFTLYKGVDKIQLRKDIRKEFSINCLNYSDVKIGDEINKISYMKASGKKWKDIKPGGRSFPRFTFGECFPEYAKFETAELNSFIDRIKDIYVDLHSKQIFKFTFDGVNYTIAKGGIHSCEKARKIVPTKDQILRDADIGSQYPNAIRKRRLFPRHLGEEWLVEYSNTIQKRIEAKQLYKKTKDGKYQSIQETYKLSLNGGGFGKTGMEDCWQYDPLVAMSCTIGNQIEILMLIEDLVQNGIRVVSANTDGIICLFDKSKEELYYKVCKEWEKQVGNEDLGQLEYSDFSLLAQTSVNDYIAVKTNGELKHKGDFMIDYEFHKNKSFRIVSLAVSEYYAKGINPVKFIKEHDNIFDFCAGIRVKGNLGLELRSVEDGLFHTEKLLKTNRYYISHKGQKLIKYDKEDGREWQIDAGKWLCTLYNKHENKPIEEYGINYNFYIEEAYKIISNVEPEVVSPYSSQLSLFSY